MRQRLFSMLMAAVLLTAASLLAAQRPGSSAAAPGPARLTPGEHLEYGIEWNPPWFLFFLPSMEAGTVELAVTGETVYEGERAIRIEFRARSSGTLARLTGLHIDDHFQFLTDPETLCTFTAIKQEREGKRKRDITVVYLRESRRLHIREIDVAVSPPQVKKDLYKEGIPECVRDLFSALYHTRRLEFSTGLRSSVVVGNNDSVREIEVRVEKKERVETPAGRYDAWRVNTIALVGGLFREGGEFRLWMTADEKKAPVQFTAKVNLGTVTGRLRKTR